MSLVWSGYAGTLIRAGLGPSWPHTGVATLRATRQHGRSWVRPFSLSIRPVAIEPIFDVDRFEPGGQNADDNDHEDRPYLMARDVRCRIDEARRSCL